MHNTTELNYFEIGNKIRLLRQQNQLTQQQLAEYACISINYLSHIENGLSKFSLPILIRIANALDTTPNCLLHDSVSNKKLSQFENICDILNKLDFKDLNFAHDLLLLLSKYNCQ